MRRAPPAPLKCAPRAAVATLALLAARPAEAVEVGRPAGTPLVVDSDDTVLVQAKNRDFDDRADNDHLVGTFGRFNLRVGWGELSAGARMDLFTAAGETPGGVSPGEVRLEKAWASWDTRTTGLTAGDVYGALGHGLLLSLRKVDELGYDTTLRGGRAEWRGDRVHAVALGGLANVRNVDPFDQQRRGDPDDRIAATGFRVRGPADVDLGANALFIAWRAAPGRDDRTAGGSVTLDSARLGPNASFAAEWALLDTHEAATGLPARDRLGRAGYAALTLFTGPWTALFEAKDFYRFHVSPPGSADPAYIYNDPPTLERPGQRVANVGNALGGRVKAARAFEAAGGRNIASASYALYAYDDTDGPRLDGKRSWHAWAELEQRRPGGNLLRVAAGWREQFRAHDEGHGRLDLLLWHADADALWRVTERQSLTLSATQTRETEVAFSTRTYSRGLSSLTWSPLPALSFSALYGWTGEDPTAPFHYPGGQLLWRTGAGPGSLVVRLFGGRTPGGRVCAGGTCRDVPAFEGGQLELTALL